MLSIYINTPTTTGIFYQTDRQTPKKNRQLWIEVGIKCTSCIALDVPKSLYKRLRFKHVAFYRFALVSFDAKIHDAVFGGTFGCVHNLQTRLPPKYVH